MEVPEQLLEDVYRTGTRLTFADTVIYKRLSDMLSPVVIANVEKHEQALQRLRDYAHQRGITLKGR